MAYGLRTYNSSGNMTFDSEQLYKGGVIVDWVTSTGSSQVRTYPGFAGRTNAGFFIISGYMSGQSLPVWDYTLGYPRVTIPAHGNNYWGYPYTFEVALFIL